MRRTGPNALDKLPQHKAAFIEPMDCAPDSKLPDGDRYRQWRLGRPQQPAALVLLNRHALNARASLRCRPLRKRRMLRDELQGQSDQRPSPTAHSSEEVRTELCSLEFVHTAKN